MRQGDWFQTSFSFLKELKMREKQVVCILVSLFFDSLTLDMQQKQTIKLKTTCPEIYSILIFQKRFWD